MDFRFVRHNGVFQIQGADRTALAAAGIRIDRSRRGEDVLGAPAASAPAGMDAQVLQFRFRSRGFFAVEPGAHLAVGVTGAWRKDNPLTPARDGLLVGRGLILGNVSAAANGCAAAPVVEIESFRRHGNRLFQPSCSRPLQENTWYRITLVANRAGGVAYRLSDSEGRLLDAAAVADAGADIPSDLAGWWLLHVFAGQHPERDWALDVSDLRVSWRPRR
ncbi:MAG TPA: hypothetical protein VFN09_02565 [Rhodanobacteraceae bacterium]|nr:hypothetical protein [Rhodanobacteraceae bacterium]